MLTRRAALLLVPLLGLVGCQSGGSADKPVAVAVSSSPSVTPVPSTPAATPEPSARVTALAAEGGELVVSDASSTEVQPQPPAGTCHAGGSGLESLPDASCTPGALNPAVTQATIQRTICVSGYTRTIRPSYSVTEPEKLASMRAYGDPDTPHAYEYDHLVSLELGGAANDARNLWPEPGGSPNPKDRLENRLHELVCSGAVPLATAQHAIATDWVSAYRRYVGTVTTTSAPSPAAAPVVTSAASSGCRASVSDATPPRGGDETVTVTTTPDATVRTQAHYKTTTSEHDGVADASGVARITFSIGRPTSGYTVRITVQTSSGQSCATAFTPQ